MENVKENGGDVQEIEIVDQVSPEQEYKEDFFIKEPIFIGHADPELLQKIEELIDKDQFELAVLSPQLQKNCRETYFFSKLGDKERDNMLAARKDAVQREQSLQSISQIEEMFLNHFKLNGIAVPDKEAGELITFKAYEMQNLISSVRGQKLSVAKIREAIENFQIHGFVTPTMNGESYHKQQFAITIDPASRLKVLSSIKDNIDLEIKVMEQRKQLYNNEILTISLELSKGSDLDSTDGEIKTIDKFALRSLTTKQKAVLKIFKNNPKRSFNVSEVSKLYNDKTSSCTDTIATLVELNIVIEKKNDKEKSFYSVNPELFKILEDQEF